MSAHPTNADILESVEAVLAKQDPSNREVVHAVRGLIHEHALSDTAFQENQILTNDEMKRSLDSLHRRVGEIPTKKDLMALMPSREEMPRIIWAVIKESMRSNGKAGIVIIVTLATVIGSLTVITGGIKTLLAWIGFTMISK